MQTIISRNEAERMNLKFYFSNHFCHNGHNTIRYVKSGECLQCLKEKKPPLSEEEKKYEALSRKEAARRGVEFYLSNYFCRNAHNRIRFVKNARCVQCVEDEKPKPTEEEMKALGRDEALNRYEAAQGGFKFYLSQHFCRNRHNRIRYVSSTQCVQCVENRKSFTDRDKALSLELQRLRKRLKEIQAAERKLQAEERKWKRK
jgi:hypothetical protein